MPVIGVTGGIASGKSTVTRLLVEGFIQKDRHESESFSADHFSHELMEHDPAVRGEIFAHFGKGLKLESGNVDRTTLRKIIFEDAGERLALEAILHPRIREAWVKRAESFRTSEHYFVAEIPLLYETESAHHFDCIVVVDADAQVQLERLSSKRGWTLESARRVIDAQMPAAEKIRRADILISNHHTELLLHRQIDLTLTALLMHYA